MGVNGILLLDKDEGWTSQDCVSKLRGILGERRIGHAGTLDPLATGLLVVLVGRATRAAAFAEAETKEYVAAFRPGIITDTQDITGNLLRSSDVLPSEEDVRAQFASSALVRRKASKPLRRRRRVHKTRKSISHVFQGRFALDIHIRSVLL